MAGSEQERPEQEAGREIEAGTYIEGDVDVAGDFVAGNKTANFFKVAMSPWVIGSALAMLAVLVVLVGFIVLASVPDTREQLPIGLRPRAFAKERKGEVLIVIAQFHCTEGVMDTAVHKEIKRAIEARAGETNLRVEVEPTRLKSDDREGAEALGKRYNASIVIWGQDSGVRVSIQFYNRKQPDLPAADVRIEETVRTQIAAPDQYAEFVTQDLPQQLTFLALFAMGEARYAEEAYAESAEIIEQAVAVYENLAEPVEGAAEAYFRLGWLYQTPLDDNEKAQDAYDRAIALDPEDVVAYSNRGNTYVDIGEYEAAVADYTRAIELNPEYAYAYNNRGNAYLEMKEYKKSLADYAYAIELNPKLAEIYNNRGNTYRNMGEYEAALADYDRAITLDPKFAYAYNNRGHTYRDMGEYEKALLNYDRAIALDPEYAQAYNNRGWIYYKQEQYEAALTNYTQAITLEPGYIAAYGNRGITYTSLEQYEAALADYGRVIALDPKDSRAYSNRGITYRHMGEYEKALSDYSQAIELRPKDPVAYLNRSNIYYLVGEYEAAVADFARVVELNPEDADAYYFGACAYAQLGQVDEACAWLEEALALVPGWRENARSDARFEAIRDAACFRALVGED